MRVWDCDPRLLADAHLLGEHREIHMLIGGNMPSHPEWLRFAADPDCLALRHECVRQAMMERYGRQHSLRRHRTPVKLSKILRDGPLQAWIEERISYKRLMMIVGMEPTRLEHGTPWERDAVPKAWYLAHRHDWSHELVREYHGGVEPLGSFYGSRLRKAAA